jgi:hypothetical protein
MGRSISRREYLEVRKAQRGLTQEQQLELDHLRRFEPKDTIFNREWLELRKARIGLTQEQQLELSQMISDQRKEESAQRVAESAQREEKRARVRSKQIREQEIGCDILCAFLTGHVTEKRSYYRLRKQEKAMKAWQEKRRIG